MSDEDRYGDSEVEIARFVFNDGRPYARMEAPPTLEEPSITDAQEDAAEAGEERFVRDRWHYLLRESGIHYERGHVPVDEG